MADERLQTISRSVRSSGQRLRNNAELKRTQLVQVGAWKPLTSTAVRWRVLGTNTNIQWKYNGDLLERIKFIASSGPDIIIGLQRFYVFLKW